MNNIVNMGIWRRKYKLNVTLSKLVFFSMFTVIATQQEFEICEGFDKCFSEKGCICDELCRILNDCCSDKGNVPYSKLKLDQFSCTDVLGLGEVMLVTKCAEDWNEPHTRRLCEQNYPKNDTISNIIVSDPHIQKMNYKNMYCALCNNVQNYSFMKAKLGCDSPELDESCSIYYDTNLTSKFRNCNLHDSFIVKKCIDNYNNIQIKQDCEEGRTLLVRGKSVFKNQACAQCNHNNQKLSCWLPFPKTFSPINRPYSVLVNINNEQVVQGYENHGEYPLCNSYQYYDPLIGSCRKIWCPPNMRPANGKCVTNKLEQFLKHEQQQNTSTTVRNISSSLDNCTYSRIGPSEYEYLNKSRQIKFRHQVYNDTDYIRNGSDVFLCISFRGQTERLLQASNQFERYMTTVGLIISIMSLIITIVVYSFFQELMNIPGKNLVCLCIALLIAQSLFLLSTSVADTIIICPLVAIIMHYFFLAVFSWMNVIAFDLLMTFTTTAIRMGKPSSVESKRYFRYKIYGWCLPLTIVLVSVVINFAVNSDSLNGFHPKYGNGICWITSRNALILFFVGPLALFKLFDFIAFGVTVYFITKAKKHGAKVRKDVNSCSLFIHIKICFILGLTWALAFIANFANNDIFWYLFTIFNSLQGLFLALSFLCNKRVLALVKSKFEQRLSTSNTSSLATRTTST